MSHKHLKLAKLSPEARQKVQELEMQLNAMVMAYEPEISIAHLRDDQLHTLQALEEELGVVLIAYTE